MLSVGAEDELFVFWEGVMAWGGDFLHRSLMVEV